MLTGLEIIDCPGEAYAGNVVTVRVRTTLRSFAPNCSVLTNVVYKGYSSGDIERFIDETHFFASGESKEYTGAFVMPEEDVQIIASTVQWVVEPNIDQTVFRDIALASPIPPPPPPPTTRYWITVAEGDTLEEAEANAQGKYASGSFRAVIKTRGAPDWLLKGAAWIANKLLGPLNGIGVDLESVEVKNSTVYLYMHGSPFVIPLWAVMTIIIAAAILGIYTIKCFIQMELTKEQYYQWKEAETKAEVIEAIKDYPPEVQDTLLGLWEAGVEPGEEGIDWEKYLKWGLIGGGVIVAGSVLIPALVRALRGRS